ncbi:MAG: hypothetical protein DA408_00255 [Bacteroidetes bacterium]|nr:MAG: hypothetical protein C7N36_08985 [Bacteroidota bacterium]PTM15086.1 MAG: hypothetical protein DA408_00255 [Bacteroidota bacterium]
MKILGIHVGHDSSAALIVDGEIVADIQEERLVRIKHSNNVPVQSIAYCLKQGQLNSINDLDYIGFSWKDTPKNLISLLGLRNNSLSRADKARLIKDKITATLKRSLSIEEILPPIYYPDFKLHDTSKFINQEHHLVHAASAYFTQEVYDQCLIFSIDGMGDEVTTSVWMGEGNTIRPLVRYGREAGIGLAYSIVTEGLHWIHGDGEGKTMGLAPYGDTTSCQGVLDKYFPVFEGEKLVKPAEIGETAYWNESGSTQFHLAEAKEVEALIKQYGRENIAAEAQRKLEDCIMNLVFGWCQQTGVKSIACAGGVFLNVKLNQRIWNNRGQLIEKQYIYPNPGDSGLAVGAALNVYYRHHPFKGYQLQDLYKGSQFTNEEVEKILKVRKLKYEYVENPSQLAAQLLAEDKIIAWFQGRMEAGPRALGNRSILMSPLKPENKDIINAWVKFREGFRPFCPSMLHEKMHEYLDGAREEFFMITSFDVKAEKKDKIPAVVHVDGTARPQLVRKETNPRYWELIHEFGKLTGEYVILNTSFNILGEPIINHPKEAIRCLFDSGIDGLFINNYFIQK